MQNMNYYSKTRRKNLVKINFFLVIILLLKVYNCQEEVDQDPVQINDVCNNSPSSLIMSNDQCFNNILKLDHKHYQTSNFAKNKNGDLVIEFSEDNDISSSRLFYGLTKDGRYFFKNQSSYTDELNIDEEILEDFGYYHFDSNYKTINLFVSIKNDPNKGNQYLFSINSYYSTVELHNFNNDSNDANIFNKNNSNHYIWTFNDFFNLNEDDYFFPYDYSLFELAKENAYIIVFVPKVDVYDDMLNISFIKQFRFKSFDYNAYEEIKSVKYNNFLENKIISSFLMDDIGLIGIFYFVKSENGGGMEETLKRGLDLLGYSQGKFFIQLYSSNLVPLKYGNEIYSNNNNGLYIEFQDDIFFKAMYLKKQFILFIYISDGSLLYEIYKFNYNFGFDIVCNYYGDPINIYN